MRFRTEVNYAVHVWDGSSGCSPRPTLVSHERGLDVTTTPVWELDFAATDRYVCIYSTDPWDIALELTLDGDMLELVVDDNLAVIERNRPLQG